MHEQNKPISQTQYDYQAVERILNEVLKLSESQQKKVLGIMERRAENSKLMGSTENLVSLADLAMEYKDANLVFEGISSGIDLLDSYLLGFKPGDVVVIGAETGLGKSTLTTRILLNAAFEGRRSCIFALEDNQREVGTRVRFLLKGMGKTPEDLANAPGECLLFPEECKDLFFKDKFSIIPAMIAVALTYRLEIIAIDMLNDIVDTVGDKDAGDFMCELKRMADSYGITLFLISRLREPTGASNYAVWKEKYAPNENTIYGRGQTKYVATKVITLSEADLPPTIVDSIPGQPREIVQNVWLHVVKNRTGHETKREGQVINGVIRKVIDDQHFGENNGSMISIEFDSVMPLEVNNYQEKLAKGGA